MKHTAFDLFHPTVALVHFIVLLVFGMIVREPAYLLVGWIAAATYNIMLKGIRATARTLAWQIPLIILIALCNMLFSSRGSTVLAARGPLSLSVESLVFGACMGFMLSSVMLVFSNASHVLTSDKVMALCGNVMPTVSLMVSMTMRLIPRFVSQGGDISDAQRACTSAGAYVSSAGDSGRSHNRNGSASHRRGRIQEGARTVSVLMGWSMEDSLETADAMKARGWGVAERRTAYMRYSFRVDDAIVLTVFAALAALSAVMAHAALGQFQFYPVLSGFSPWWNYLPYALLVAIAPIAEFGEWLRWRD